MEKEGNNRKPLITGIIVAALIAAMYGATRVLKLKEAADEFRVSLASLPKVHTVNISGVTISADLKIDNPTPTQLKIKIPSVVASYKGKTIATTVPSDQEFTIGPNSVGRITGIKVQAGLLNLMSLFGSGIMSDFVAGKAMQNLGFEVTASVNGIPIKVTKVA
jgi:hypothetical protein